MKNLQKLKITTHLKSASLFYSYHFEEKNKTENNFLAICIFYANSIVLPSRFAKKNE
jgi:hypothetical protein